MHGASKTTQYKQHLDVALPPGEQHEDDAKEDHEANNAKEGRQVTRITERNRHVHSKHTADQVQRDEYRGQEGDLAENLVGVRTLCDTVDRDCRKVIAVCPGQDLFEVTEVGSHGHNVVLNVTQVHANVHPRSHLVVFVASLGETTENIRLATQESEQSQAVLAGAANGSKE